MIFVCLLCDLYGYYCLKVCWCWCVSYLKIGLKCLLGEVDFDDLGRWDFEFDWLRLCCYWVVNYYLKNLWFYWSYCVLELWYDWLIFEFWFVEN